MEGVWTFAEKHLEVTRKADEMKKKIIKEVADVLKSLRGQKVSIAFHWSGKDVIETGIVKSVAYKKDDLVNSVVSLSPPASRRGIFLIDILEIRQVS